MFGGDRLTVSWQPSFWAVPQLNSTNTNDWSTERLMMEWQHVYTECNGTCLVGV